VSTPGVDEVAVDLLRDAFAGFARSQVGYWARPRAYCWELWMFTPTVLAHRRVSEWLWAARPFRGRKVAPGMNRVKRPRFASAPVWHRAA
jgi:hypothetical protein